MVRGYSNAQADPDVAAYVSLYALAEKFGVGILDVDTVTVAHFAAIMQEQAKAEDEARSS